MHHLLSRQIRDGYPVMDIRATVISGKISDTKLMFIFNCQHYINQTISCKAKSSVSLATSVSFTRLNTYRHPSRFSRHCCNIQAMPSLIQVYSNSTGQAFSLPTTFGVRSMLFLPIQYS